MSGISRLYSLLCVTSCTLYNIGLFKALGNLYVTTRSSAVIRGFQEPLTSKRISEIRGMPVIFVRTISKRHKATRSSEGSEIDAMSCSQKSCAACKKWLTSKFLRNLDVRQTNPSVETVLRFLREVGLFGCRPAKKPLISTKNRKALLDWAHAHKNWAIQQ
uniref:HTH_Tnp_Tc3_2 domain-containing protein n=1 Tax=Haemonchus placei TaxID=6290 RepID=A0A0N4VRV9_HAEPC